MSFPGRTFPAYFYSEDVPVARTGAHTLRRADAADGDHAVIVAQNGHAPALPRRNARLTQQRLERLRAAAPRRAKRIAGPSCADSNNTTYILTFEVKSVEQPVNIRGAYVDPPAQHDYSRLRRR